jgi:hypothetical protein
MKACRLGQIGIASEAYSRAERIGVLPPSLLASEAPHIHCLFCIAFASDKFLHQASLNIVGAMTMARWPFSHRSFQKLVRLPFPTAMRVHAWNRAVSVAWRHTGILDQGLCGSFHFSHCHLSRMARLNFLRSRIPRPPLLLGIRTRFELM